MDGEYIYKFAEKKANRFNVYCLFVMSILGFLALILNEFGIFTLDKLNVRVAMISLFVLAAIPGALYVLFDAIKRDSVSILERPWFKSIILISSFLSTLILCTALSFQTILVLVIPTLMAAQYRNKRSVTIIIFASSILLIVLSVFGSVFFGIYDANLLKPLTKEEATIFKNRVNLLTASRTIMIIFHYILPRILCVTAINYIGLSITKRNSEMIDTQIRLNNKVQEEVLAKTTMQNSVIEHLADIIESRDLETGEHIKRTKNYVAILVNKMKTMDQYKTYLTPKTCENIIAAAPLHDIGKIGVSDLILCKPGKLTPEEFEKMKTHTTKGGEIIQNILKDLGDQDFLDIAYQVATAHHEKWDGAGYPLHLKEEDIPLPGRIMAIADVFDALVAERVYKKPIPIDEAIEIIKEESGTHFDPKLVDIFKEVTGDFRLAATEKL